MNNQNQIFSRREIFLALLSLIPVGYFLLAYYFSPYHYVMLVVEDGFGDWVGVALYLSASYLALRLGITLRRDHKPCFFIFCFSLGAFVLAMEEISWGECIFGFDIPSISKHNDQDEVNIHNIIGNRNIEMVAGWVVLLYGVVFPLILGVNKRLEMFFSRINFPSPPAGSIPISWRARRCIFSGIISAERWWSR